MLESSVADNKGFTGKGLLKWIFGDKEVTDLDLAIAKDSGSGVMVTETPSAEVMVNPPRFLRHVRPVDYWGDDEVPAEFSPKGGFTVAVDLMPNENKLQFSYAICSPEDLFNKRKARNICETRMNAGDLYEVSDLVEGFSVMENIQAAIENYLTGAVEEPTIQAPRLSKISMRTSDQDFKNILKYLD
jgi:hypothetical protein